MSVFFLAHTNAKSQVSATVKLEVLHDGTLLKGKPLTSTLNSGQEFSAVVQGFAISSAANGEYELRETLVQGDKSTTRTGKFVLKARRIGMPVNLRLRERCADYCRSTCNDYRRTGCEPTDRG